MKHARLPVVNTDLLDWVREPNYPNRLLVCTTNMTVKRDGTAVMGAGLAKQVADAYPDIAAEYGSILKAFAQREGERLGHPTSDPLSLPEGLLVGQVFMSRTAPVVFLNTKTHWRSNSREDFVLQNLQALRGLIADMRHMMFGVPLPGAGLGNLDREWVIDALHTVLGDLPNVTIVDLHVQPSGISRELMDLVRANKVLVVSGHRPNKLGGYSPQVRMHTREVAGQILDQIQPTLLVHGGALGVDKAFADAAEERGLRVIYAEPCRNSASKWNPREQETAARQMAYAASTGAHVIVHEGPYTSTCMQERNVWMLELLKYAGPGSGFTCVHDGSPGGTANCKEAFAEMFRGRRKELYYGNFWLKFTKNHPLPATVADREIMTQTLRPARAA